MLTRQNRRPPEGAISITVSMTQTMKDRIVAEAEREGHYNNSAVVNRALVEYFERRDSEGEAA
jgi:Arc/MetJ-type ribon-helix-helix transcriptional regulator